MQCVPGTTSDAWLANIEYAVVVDDADEQKAKDGVVAVDF